MTTANDKREYSREGFLLADAVIGKVGALPYTRGELGIKGNPQDVVKINRSREVLESALPSMIGAPLTIDHPQSFIGTGDADSHVVGSVVSIPEIDAQGRVKAKVRVFDGDAIEMIKSGDDQLSPGFNFVMKDWDDTSGTGNISEMSVNHVAIVPNGRAGEAVRIMDALPPNLSLHKESEMTLDNKQLQEVIAKAVDAAMSAKGNANQDADATKAAFVSAISDSIKPVLDQVGEMKAAQDKAIQEAKDKEAKDKADKEKNDLIQSVIDGERARYAVLSDAKRMAGQDKHEAIDAAKDVKEVMVLAIGDSIKDAADKSEDYLKGVFDQKVAALDATPATDASGVPAGVVQSGTQASDKVNMYRKRFEDRNKPKMGGK